MVLSSEFYMCDTCKSWKRGAYKTLQRMNCVTHFKNNLVLFKRKLSFKGFVSKGRGQGRNQTRTTVVQDLSFCT